jgi:predicted TPR repeat methyltransferase
MDAREFTAASSGSVIADRRLDIARQFEARGDRDAAADLARQALDIAPGWAAGWFALGDILMKAGDPAGAVPAFRQALDLDPADRHGASLKLALLNAIPPLARMPDAYVRALFDQYAQGFEAALVDRLAYRAPWLMREAVDRCWLSAGQALRVIDLGCGTGLAGAVFADRIGRIDGIDLSPGMLAEAGKKNIYAMLEAAEIRAWLQGPHAPYDLALAADVLIYLGALDDIFAGVRALLTPGGLFCFTVQSRSDEDDFALGADHRYSYTRPYLERCAAQAGYVLLELSDCILRKDEGRDVEGTLCVLKNP